MKGLVPINDPPGTKEGHQVIRTTAPNELLAQNGLGAVVPRHDPYAQREIEFPDVVINDTGAQNDIHPQSARQLDPIVASEFANQGKPIQHLGSPRRLWMSLDPSHKLAIDGWPPEDGYFAKWIRTNRIRVTRGFQTALMDSVNIDRPESGPYGTISGTVSGASSVGLESLYVW